MCSASFEFTVPSECDGKQARIFLRKYCRLSAESIKLLKQSPLGICKNGRTLRTIDNVRTGDIIRITLPTDKNEITPVEGPLDIVYEDGFLLIVNKPCLMPVHPVKVHQTDTLANIVSYYQKSRGEEYTFRALNRLDKDTSGCVMIPKDRITYGILRGNIDKEYVAVCEGIIEEEGTINAPIGLKSGSKIIRETRPDGKSAVTRYSPIRHSDTHTLLSLHLETGRTHQIRCHMSSIGHPLAGDDLYGGSLSLIRHQALQCRKVLWQHPYTQESVVVDTGIPEELLKLIEE